MRILIQRVSKASVEVEGKQVGSIDHGALVFVGITHGDTKESASKLAHKFANLRMFSDEQGKLNLSILENKGSALVISQFTLYADCSDGRRPSFTKAAPPDLARDLYEEFVREVKKQGISTETGVFGAKMKVSLINEGPMTLAIEG